MKRIIALLLTAAMLVSVIAIPTYAATGEVFLADVALIYEDSVNDAKAAIAGTDWQLFEQDLNDDADFMFDNGVYLIYKTTTNVEEAITDLRVMDMYGGYTTANYEKQLEASRAAYMKAVSYIRIAAAEFKARYDAGDEMAKLAYRQMNYYKDIGETGMLMGDFMLNIPTDDALVTVMMEGNMYVVTNLITLLAVGISGADGKSLKDRIVEKSAIKDTLTDAEYYDAASSLASEFSELYGIVKKYDNISAEFNLTDEDISEEEYEVLSNYGSLIVLLDEIPYQQEGYTLLEFIASGDWELRDLYPIVAALSEGQRALSEMGVFTTVLQYAAPSDSIEALYAIVEETEKEITDENGNLKIFDVYMGVDRSIFDGNFAFTSAAERQQALTGIEWTAGYYLSSSEKKSDIIPYALVNSLLASGAAVSLGTLLTSKIAVKIAGGALRAGASVSTVSEWTSFKIAGFLTGGTRSYIGGAGKYFFSAGIGLIVAALGVVGVSVWYGYYNPDYTPIPGTLIDVRETDFGDKYIKYTAAKVFGEEDMYADFNAYQAKEWIALYYTKDATAGNCLTPNFVFKDSDSTIARRHQGIAMFGETKAFNLNSHVFNSGAKGSYVTVRYSNTKKAAADVPTVVGSMFTTGALYAVTALAGVFVGAAATTIIQKAAKKEDASEPEEAE